MTTTALNEQRVVSVRAWSAVALATRSGQTHDYGAQLHIGHAHRIMRRTGDLQRPIASLAAIQEANSRIVASRHALLRLLGTQRADQLDGVVATPSGVLLRKIAPPVL
jgi:hypothetical protein